MARFSENNPFDPVSLRLDQNFAETVGVKKLLTTVPVRKPKPQDFVRVHSDPGYRLTPAAIITLKEESEVYLVTPDIAIELPGEYTVATLFTSVNRQGVLHLWPVKLPGPDGKHNVWHRSEAEAADYASGDPYLAFAKQAGAVPPNATKASHKSERELYKACVLAVQYGMSAEGLASRIGQPPILARELLRLHRETYCVFWRWSDAALDHAMLTGSLHTVFGWRVQVSANANPRSLRNFPMQANGAEMLAPRLLHRNRKRHRGLRSCARRGADRRSVRASGSRYCADERRDAGIVASSPQRVRTRRRRRNRQAPRPIRRSSGRRHVETRHGSHLAATIGSSKCRGVALSRFKSGGLKRGCFRPETRIRRVSSMSNHSGDDDWDPNHLRLAGGEPATQDAATRGGHRVASVRDKFIAGPIDVAWLSQASKLGVTALWVGLALWFVRGLRGSDSFLVSNLIMRDWGVLPDAKSRALRKLQKAGLIAIEGRGKRSPLVTLVVAPSSAPGNPNPWRRPRSRHLDAAALQTISRKTASFRPGHLNSVYDDPSDGELTRKNSPDDFAKNGGQ